MRANFDNLSECGRVQTPTGIHILTEWVLFLLFYPEMMSSLLYTIICVSNEVYLLGHSLTHAMVPPDAGGDPYISGKLKVLGRSKVWGS